MAWQYIVLGLSMLAVAGVLFWGIFSMTKGANTMPNGRIKLCVTELCFKALPY